MPRFSFAMPVAPQMWDEWRKTAANLPLYQPREHRDFLLSRGIFREKVWLQRGEGSPELTLVLWDLDSIERAGSSSHEPMTPHERWLMERVLGRLHGIRGADIRLPEVELLSGTTIATTAAADTQTTFALPLHEGAESAAREFMARIEGDLAVAHGDFLDASQIREEWIWLQKPILDLPAMLLIHWIGDDLSAAWHRLADGEDDFARAAVNSLFTRLVGVSPSTVAGWAHELVVSMHVRRSDHRGPDLRRQAMRFVRTLLDPAATAADEFLTVLGPEMWDRLRADIAAQDPSGSLRLADVLVSDHRALAILDHGGAGDGSGLGLLLRFCDGKVAGAEALPLAGDGQLVMR